MSTLDPALPTTGSRASRGETRSMVALGVSAALLALLSLGPQPEGPRVETAGAQQIRAFVADHGADLRLHALLTATLVPTVLVFAASLAALAFRRGSWVSGGVVLAAGAVVVVPPLLDAAVSGATLVQALDGTPLATVPDATVLTWYAMTNATHVLGDLWMAAIATMIAAGSLAILSSRALPRWLGLLGLVVAAAGAVGVVGVTLASPAISVIWFVGLVGWLVWSVAVAVCALRVAARDRSRRKAVT